MVDGDRCCCRVRLKKKELGVDWRSLGRVFEGESAQLGLVGTTPDSSPLDHSLSRSRPKFPFELQAEEHISQRPHVHCRSCLVYSQIKSNFDWTLAYSSTWTPTSTLAASLTPTQQLFIQTHLLIATMDQVQELLDQPVEFLRDGRQFLTRCTKPDKREFLKIGQAVAVGFLVMGAVG